MALITCKECKAKISSDAKACPQCGYKRRKSSGGWVLLGGIVLVVVLSSWLTPSGKKAAVVDPKKEADFQNVVRVAKWAKNRSKNPASFELTYAGISGSGTVCIEFRATNSFNAVVPGIYVMSNTVSGDTAKLWNDECAGRGLDDYTYARTAL
jgi:RNA polymerase subunit RPABC4/transcription elongation factor Spt4